MKVLLLSRYGRAGASSRIRSYQYLPFLEAEGIHVTVSPLVEDNYLHDLYSNSGRKVHSLFQAYFKRVGCLFKCRRFDLLWIEYELLPWMPHWAEKVLAAFGIPYLVDYDDAIFHRYDMHPRRLIRLCLGRKIDRVMQLASKVVVGNEYLAERAWQSGARKVGILPSVVDLNRYRVEKGMRNKVFTVGWIGSPTTAPYLEAVTPAIEEFARDRDVRLVLVGSGKVRSNGGPVEVREWSEDREVGDIQSFDVGIMPLPNEPWALGKCGYKLVQYMACALPVVASPIGVNKEMVRNGWNGFLAEGKEEWVQALNILYGNPNQREEMGKAGRALVEEKFCLQVTAPRLRSLLTSAAGCCPECKS
jgi:glycosyltransferase involved in cell wall biosynthesis